MRSTTRCCIAQSKIYDTLSCYRLAICHVTKATQTYRVSYLQGYSGCSDVFFMIQLVFCSLVAQSTIRKIQYSGCPRCTPLSPACRPCSRLRSHCLLRRSLVGPIYFTTLWCVFYSFNSREMTYQLQAYFLRHCGLLSGVP